MILYKGDLSACIDPKRLKEAFTKKEGSVFHL
jgi:hypothetical protein